MKSDIERVALIHGLAETPLHMHHIGEAARLAGYDVSYIAYPSTQARIEILLSEHVAPQIDALSVGVSRLHFVTHSLGGVLLHAYLQRERPEILGRVVMQAPGLRGSETLEMFRHNPLFRWAYGPASDQSGTGPDGFATQLNPRVDYELGVIAGCLSFDLLPLFFVPPPHDGKISVARTKLGNLTDHIVLPTTHDAMMHHPLAVFQTLRFLTQGHFLHILRRPDAAHELSA